MASTSLLRPGAGRKSLDFFPLDPAVRRALLNVTLPAASLLAGCAESTAHSKIPRAAEGNAPRCCPKLPTHVATCWRSWRPWAWASASSYRSVRSRPRIQRFRAPGGFSDIFFTAGQMRSWRKRLTRRSGSRRIVERSDRRSRMPCVHCRRRRSQGNHWFSQSGGYRASRDSTSCCRRLPDSAQVRDWSLAVVGDGEELEISCGFGTS